MTGGSSFLATTSPNGSYQSILGFNAAYIQILVMYTQGLPRALLARTLSSTILESLDEAYAQVIYKSSTRGDGVRITLIYKACCALLGRTLRGFGKFQSVHLWTTIITIKL